MLTTSHFVGIELNSEIFSDLYVKIFGYLKENQIENILSFQNLLSIHITLYYFEKDLDNETIFEIKNTINNIKLNDIFLDGFNYFFRNDKEFLFYLKSKTQDNLFEIRNIFHSKFKRDFIEDNIFSFTPHITFFKIKNFEVYALHKSNVEKIILEELNKIGNISISSNNIYLYKVNSKFKEELQIKVFY